MTRSHRRRRSRAHSGHEETSPAVPQQQGLADGEYPAKAIWLIAIGLAAITVLVFAPIRNHPFFSFDDPGYVYENPKVKAGLTIAGVKWAMTTGYFANWHPVTWLSHMLDVQLFGLNAGAHHTMNLLFHVVNSLLLFLVFYQTTKRAYPSAFVAALFAVHPMHVESVAWISERKDVLSTFFWLVTTLAYFAYARRPNVWRYALVAVLFALGLMTKPMLVTLPLVLLLLDVWPLRRLTFGVDPASVGRRLFYEKVPLLALAAASSVVTIIVQRQAGAVESLVRLPLIVRAANAVIAYGAYLHKLIWPARLAVLYPYPTEIDAVTVGVNLVVLAIVTAVAVRAWRNHPYLWVGWAWFLGTLVPVIGIVQVGKQAMADRYSYVPAIGLFVMIAWGVPALLRRFSVARIALPFLAAISIAALAIVARTQVGYWKSNITLWTHTLDVTGDNYLAENNIGWDFAGEKRYEEAVPHYRKALHLSPKFVGGHTNLALTLVALGRFDEAIAEYNEVLRIEPKSPLVIANLGIALARQGRLPEAIARYEEAIRLKPDYDEAHSALGRALARQGRVDEAIAHYRESLRLNPLSAEVHSNLGTAFASQGNLDSAITHFSEAVRLKPDYVDAQNNLGIALSSQGKLDQAIAHFSEAARLDPTSSAPHHGLGSVYETQGRIAEASREYGEALRLNPNDADARRALEVLQRAKK